MVDRHDSGSDLAKESGQITSELKHRIDTRLGYIRELINSHHPSYRDYFNLRGGYSLPLRNEVVATNIGALKILISNVAELIVRDIRSRHVSELQTDVEAKTADASSADFASDDPTPPLIEIRYDQIEYNSYVELLRYTDEELQGMLKGRCKDEFEYPFDNMVEDARGTIFSYAFSFGFAEDLYNKDLCKRCILNASVPESKFTDWRFLLTKFVNSDISASDFSNTDALYSSFYECSVNNSNFLGTVLSSSSIYDSSFKNSCFDNSVFRTQEPPLQQTMVMNSNFSGSSFVSADISHTILKNSNFTNTDFTSANLSHSDLSDSDFRGTTFTDAIFDDVCVNGAYFDKDNMDLPAWIRAGVGDDGKFSNETLEQSINNGFTDIKGANWIKASFSGDITNIIFKDVKFVESGANFDDAKCENSEFVDCNFQSSRWHNCNLRGTTFKNTVLAKSIFCTCDLCGVHFTGKKTMLLFAQFNDCELEGATFDLDMAVPENIKEHLDKNGVYRNAPMQ